MGPRHRRASHHHFNQRAGAANSKLAEEPLQIRLAVSLHGATDEVRNRIMPINRRYNIETLLSACDYYNRSQEAAVSRSNTSLIADVNDSDEQARLLLATHAGSRQK